MSAPLLSDPGLPLADLHSRLDFARLLDQHGRMLLLDTALPRLALVPERLALREAVSAPFELVLDALSTSRHFELKSLIGEQMSVRRLLSDGSYAPWHGYVTEAAQLGADGGLARYRLVMRPWLSLLTVHRDSRIFPNPSGRFRTLPTPTPRSRAASRRLPPTARCHCARTCPRTGWWVTPAATNARRHFQGRCTPVFRCNLEHRRGIEHAHQASAR